MSANYPNRADWLAVRRTPRNLKRGKWFHIATDYRWLPVDPTQPAGAANFVRVATGKSYRRAAT
jgi:hypothetical protein